MKLIKISVLCLSLAFLNVHKNYAQARLNVKKDIQNAIAQYTGMLRTHQDTTKFPQSLDPKGVIKDMPANWWCSGFFAGSLWYLYEYTHNPEWKNAADKWTMAVAGQRSNKNTHDLGFMLYCSFGNGYRLTGQPAYKAIMLEGAHSLSTRFHPEYGVIKSWDGWKNYDYPVIIDNMMNLEYLLWAAHASSDKNLQAIAVSHADLTIKNHFRKDFSSFHVVCYGPGGKVLAQKTHQGYSDSSAWSRGQGWGLYGYTLMYRETKQLRYLKQAEKIAKFILDNPNLPKDKIPYWDFNAPDLLHQERDASAAAVIASGLLELSQYSSQNRKKYFDAARQILISLSGPKYRAEPGTNGYFILKHSVGSKPQNSEVDVPIIYADYYYLEALLRYERLEKKQQLKFL